VIPRSGPTVSAARVLLGAFLFLPAALALEERDIFRALQAHGIACDTGAVRRAGMEGILKAIDPGARLVSREEAAAPASDRSVGKAEEWAEGLCYLRLNGLYEDAETDVVRRVSGWAAAAKSGLVLDLRAAGGTRLAALDAIAGLFAASQSELYEVRNGRGATAETRRASTPEPAAGRLPLMLLVNAATRDAAEALAAVLKGRPGVMLIGERTRGDAALRAFLPVDGTSMMYIATGRIVPASKVEYDRVGVAPDIAVSNAPAAGAAGALPESDFARNPPSDRARLDRELMKTVAADACLARATDILLALKALRDKPAPAGARPPPDASGAPATPPAPRAGGEPPRRRPQDPAHDPSKNTEDQRKE
jgi:hypothetical protein